MTHGVESSTVSPITVKWVIAERSAIWRVAVELTGMRLNERLIRFRKGRLRGSEADGARLLSSPQHELTI